MNIFEIYEGALTFFIILFFLMYNELKSAWLVQIEYKVPASMLAVLPLLMDWGGSNGQLPHGRNGGSQDERYVGNWFCWSC